MDSNILTREEHLTTADVARTARGEDERPIETETSAQGAQQLFPAEVANDFRSRWEKVQTGFVDEPRRAVQQADELVADAIKRLAESFARERDRLEHQWDRG